VTGGPRSHPDWFFARVAVRRGDRFLLVHERKHGADSESLGAEWVSIEDLRPYPLRGTEVEQIVRYVTAGGDVYPPAVLAHEAASFGG
jgi:hypothetical protein